VELSQASEWHPSARRRPHAPTIVPASTRAIALATGPLIGSCSSKIVAVVVPTFLNAWWEPRGKNTNQPGPAV
jgi:hypothetical protein